MLHLLVFVVFIWPILFLPLIFICGKASKTKTVKTEQKSDGAVKSQEDGKIGVEPKMSEEPHETNEEKEYKEEQKILKERDDPQKAKEIYELLNDKKKLEERVIHGLYEGWFREDSINSCRFWEHFGKCDLDKMIKYRYIYMRIAAKAIAANGDVIEIGRWMYADIKVAEIWLRFFEKVVNEYYEAHHKQHASPDVQEKLKKVNQQILDQHKVILTAYDEFKKNGIEVYVRSEESYKIKEKWADNLFKLGSESSDRVENENSYKKVIREVLDCCQKDGGYECDFLERINYYIRKQRTNSFQRYYPSFQHTCICVERLKPVPVGDICSWLKLDVKSFKESLVLIKERLGKHKEHAKDPKKLDEVIEKHEKMLAKIEECNKTLEAKDKNEDVDPEMILKEHPSLGGVWSFETGYIYKEMAL